MDVDSNGVSQALSSIEAALNSIQKAINNVQSAQGSLDSRISGKIGGFGGAISSLTSALSSTKTIISKCDEYISETSDAILFLQNLTSELLGDMTNDDILSLGKGPLNKEFLEDPEGYMKKINDEKAKKELKEKLIEYGFSKADADRITRGEIDNNILQQRISEVQSEIYNEYCNGNSARYEQLVTAALFNGLYFSRSESTDRKKEIETSISESETGKKTSKKERELYEKAINGAKYDFKNGVYVYNDNGSIRTFDKVSFEMLKEMRDSAISNEEAYDTQIKLLNEELKEIDTKLSDSTRKDFTYKSMAEIDARIKEITDSQQGKTDEEKKALDTEKEELLYIKAAIEENIQYALENDKYRYQSDFEENSGFNADETREITHFENGGNIVINIFGIEDGKYTFMDNDEYRGALLSRMLNGDAKIIPDFQGSALNVVGDSQEFYFYGNERQLLFKEYQDWINASTEKGENEPVVITPNEIKTFNYICKTDKDGYAAGYRYLKEKEMEFDKRFTEIKAAEDSANAHANGWLGAVSLFTAIPEAIMNTGKIITRKRSGQQLHLSDSYSTSNVWNATISSDMHKYSDVLGYAYDTLYSADRMLLSAVTSYATGGTGTLSSIATNGVMYGLPTFTSTVHTSKTKGIDDDRALRYALVCATARTLATSYTLTKASGLESTFNNMLTNGNVMSKISSLVSGSSILSKNPELAKNVLLAGYCMVLQGTVAGTTAVVDKTLTSVADTLINGDMSDVSTKFKDYKTLHPESSDFDAYMYLAGDNLSNSFSTYISAFGPGALLGMVKASGIIEHQKTLPQNINFKEAFEVDKKSPQKEFVSSGNNPSGGGPSGGLRPSSSPNNDSGPSGKTSDSKTELNSTGSSDWIVVKPKVPGEDDFDDFPDGINIKASNAFNANAMQMDAKGQDVTILGSETNGDASIGHFENHVEMAVDENGISVPNSTSVWVSESGLSSNQGSIQQVNANDILNIDSANLPQSDSTIPNLTDSYGVKVPVESLIDGKPVDSFTVIDTNGNNDSFVLPFAPTFASISATGNNSLLSKLQTTGSLTKTDWCKLTGAFTKKQLAEVKKLEDIETNITNNGNKVTKEDFNYLYKKSGLPLNFQKKIQQKFENDGLITEKYTTDSAVDSTDKSASYSSPDLYHIDTMPQSEIPKRQEAITKILKGEKLNIGDRLALGGRDHVVKEINGYQLKPDHVYRVTDIKAWEDYVKNGKIVRNVPDFIPGENNGGVDWYLGGAANPTGRYSDGENTIIIEAPADKKYFTPSLDNGLGMADDISVRHMKSSSQANPVPLSMVKVIKGQDVIDNWTNIQKFKTILGKEISDVSQNKDGTITVTTRYGEKLNITKDGLNSQNFEHEILEKNREHENALKNDVTSTFYHGGVTSDFDKSQIDILHKGEKQSTKNSNYSGFYMYGDQNYDGAVGYAKQSGKDKGVIELTLSNDLKIHEVPPFKITRITPDEIKKLQDEGFDLIKGKMLGKDEYVLLNKDKIIETKFHDLNPNASANAESIDDDKSATLKIDLDSIVKSIIGKDQLSDNQQRILSEQVARYMRLSSQNIASNPVHLDKDGKFELQAGDLIHVSNIGNLESIAQKGILTGQAVGVEEFMETYFCADFFRVPQKESLSTFTENFRENYTKGLPSDYDMSEPTIRSFDIGFIVTPTEQNKDLLSYDAYERKDGFNAENTAATRTFVNTKGLLDYEGAAPYAANGGYSSILYGVPASQISTIMVGNGWVVRDVEKTIQEYCDAQKYLVGFDSLRPVVEKQARRTFAKRGEKIGIEDYTVEKFIDKLHKLFPKANIVSYDGTVLYDASKNVANLGNEQINEDENKSTPIVLKSPDEILETYIREGMDKYSRLSLKKSIYATGSSFDISDTAEEIKQYLELAVSKEQQDVLAEILFNGGYNGFGFDSNLCSNGKIPAELARRLSMATLYLTNPETFMSLAENGVNMFHGTNSSILSSVLENGLNSVDKIEQSGKAVTTGEFGTLNSGTFDMHNSIRGRNFISFTDIFDLSYGYARAKDDGTFKVIIGTTADDINSSRKVSISGDLTEIGVRDNLPVDKIKTILVPGDKVEYVKTMVGDKDIKVLSLDGYEKKAFHYTDEFASLPASRFDEFKKYVKDKVKTNVTVSVIDVSKINTERQNTDMLARGVDPNILNMSYKGYDFVYKTDSNVEIAINNIISDNKSGRILLELDNTVGLTHENLSKLPTNVEIRILGNYGVENFKGFASNDSGLVSLQHATYSIAEMKEIINVIAEFEKGINQSWDELSKAQYAYDFLKNNIKYVANPGGNVSRAKQFDGLVSLLAKESTCQGFAHTYKELLDRMGIKCTEISGQLDRVGQHAFNVVNIAGNNIIVDTTRESLGDKFEGSGFGVDYSQYWFKSNKDLAMTLTTMQKINLKRTSQNNTVDVFSYNSDLQVIDVSKIDTEKHDTDLTKGVDSNIMNMSYKGYDLVFKPNSDVDSVISEIVREKPAGKILLELESTKGLTIENLSLLPENVEIRVLGDYGIEYFNGFPSNYDENALASLNNTTYSISEMKKIMKVINDFDSGIQSSWGDDVKAEYAYQYLTEILVMGCRFVADVGIENINNNKIYDGLMGLLNKTSSDKGFAHIYKELLNRMNIKCTEVQGIIKQPSKKDKGPLNLAGYHVFNVITIDGKNIIVDVSRDHMGPEYNGSGFGVINQSEYEFVSSKELADNLITMRKLKLKRAAKYIKKKYTKNIKLANEGEIWDFESIFSGITSSNTERVKNLINWAKTEGIKKIIDFFDGKIDASKIDLNKLIILEEEEYYALLDAEGEDKSTLGFNLGNVSVIGVPSSVLVSSHIYEAIIHELLHQISNPDDYCFWDIDEETFYKISGFDILTNKGDLDRRITQLGDAPTPYKGFNEAVTDYFAGLIFPKGAHTSGYNNIVDGLKRILSLNIPGFNVETLKNSYLNNDITMFKNVIDEAIGEGFFENELCPAFNKAESGNSIYKQMLDETIDMLEMIIETNKLLLAKYGEQFVSNNKFDYAKFNKLFELFKTSEFSKKSFEEQIKMISGIVDYECLSVALKDIILEALDEMKIKNNDAASKTVEHFEKQEETFENTEKNDETIATDTSKTIEDPKLTEENREGNWWDDDAFWDTSADDSISDLNQNANTMLLDEKKAIIEKYSKGEFTDFLTGDTDGRILSLLDAEGLKILGSSKLLEDRIRYILTYSKYKNELLTNKTFLDMFLKSNISDYYAVMNGLNFETYDAILNECVQRGDNNAFKELFTFFDREYKLKVLDNWSYSTDLLYEVFKTYNPEVMAKILSNYNIDLLSHNINLKSLFEAAKHSVLKAQESRYLYGKEIAELSIPVNMITTQMAQQLWENYDIFVLRKILNNANYSTDITVLNEYIKKQEEQIISDSLTTGMTGQFLSIHNAYSKMRQFDESSDEYYYARNELRTLLSKLEQFELMEELNQEYDKNGIDGVRDYILNLNNNSISNYIIDYHFEENYHNIMLDLKELLDFYYAGNVNIPLDRVGVYQKILNIDSLSLQEKIELHEQLKGMDIMGQFYDDMEVSRRIVGEAVRDYSLDSESIKQYRNDELSQKYGVDVYTIENNPFFAIVKTGRHQTDTAPTGHSYSLIGHGGIAVFGNVNDSNTYLYDASSLNPQQLVHVFPFDSFTLYRPFEYSDSATRRVNLLMMPDELMDKTGYSYNEMLILERGRNSTGIDETIPELQKMALYCIDNITEENVRIAKEQGVGIFLINSKNYHKQDSVPSSIYRHNIDKWNYDYFDGEFEREKFEKLRKLDQIVVKSDTEETINPQSNDKISASKLNDFLYKKNIINTSMYMKHVLKNGLYNFFDDESTEQNIISVLESLSLHYVSRNIIQRYNTENGFDYKGFLNYVLTHDKLGSDDIKRLEQLKDIQAIKTNPDAELTKIDALLDDIQRFVNGKDGSIDELNNTVFNYLSFLSYYVSRDVNFRIKNRNLLYRIARKLNKLSKQYIETKENSTIEYRGVKITTYGDDSQFLKTSLQRVLELIEKLPEALLKQFNALSTLKVFDSFNPGNLQALFENEKIFNDPSETSFYTAANYNSEYDIMQIFRNGIENNSDRDLFSTISHELGHSLDNHMITPFGEYFTDKTDLWTKAIHSDNNSVSSYGDTMTIEDFAEMVGLYSQALLGYVDIKNVSQKHPARFRILKNLFDLNAFDDNNPSSLSFKRKLEILGTFDEALKDNTHIMESLLGSDLLKTFYNLSPDKKVSLARLMSEYGTNNQFVYLFLNDNYLSDFSSYQLLELCNIYMGKEIFGPMLLRIFVHFSEKDVINYTGILEGLSDLKKTNMDEFMFISTLKKYIKESETEGFNYLALYHTFMKYRHMVGSEVYYKALKLFFDNFK